MAREARNRATTVKKGGGILGKILCLILGFILGIVGTIGGVGGLGYYVVTQVKIKDAFDTINGMTGAEITYTDYINEQLGEGSTYDLIMTLVDAVDEIGNGSGSLETLNKISPFVGTSIQGLIDSVKEYGIELEYDVLMNKPFAELGTYLSTTLNGIEIAPILNTVGVEASGLIALICYGEEGRDFYYETDANGNYVYDENGYKIVVTIEGSQPATVGSLIDGVLLNERLGNLSFKGLLSSLSNGGINAEDTLIRTLAYGVQGEDYVMVDGEIVPLPVVYGFNSADNTFIAPDGSVFSAVPGTDGFWKSGDMLIMRNEGEDSDLYEFEVVESKVVDGETKFTVLYQLGYDADDGARFIAYKGGVAQVRGGLLLSDVIGEDANLMDAIAPIRLGDLIGLDGSADSIILSLAYGVKDVDYTINPDTNQIELLPNGKAPLTIGDLTSGQLDFLDTLQLASLLDVELTKDNVNDIMVILAYGNNGTHFYFDENDELVWNTNPETNEKYAPRTIGDLLDNQNLLNEIQLGSLLGVELTKDNTNDLMVILAYGNAGTHFYFDENDELVWNTNPETNEKYGPRTIQYLIENATSLLDDLELGSLLGVELTPDSNFNDFMIILAYGSNGTHFYFDENDELVWNTNPETNETYGPRTIQYLIDNKDTLFEDLLSELQIGSLIGIELTPDSNFNDFMIILAYGSKGTHYNVNDNGTPDDESDDFIYWLQDDEGNEYAPRTIQYLIDHQDTLMDDLMSELQLGTLLGVELTPNSNFNDFMIILAYGNKGTHYDVNDNGTPDDESDDFIYWLPDDEGNEYGPRTIQYLIDNKDNLMNEIELGSLLGVELTPDSNFNDFMIVLAYGSNGTHFYFDENDNLVWKNNPETNEKYGPRTIQYLIDNKDTLMDDLMSELQLGDLLGIELTPNSNFSDLMVILAYGDKGTHYDVNNNGTPEDESDDFIYWLKDDEGNEYTPRTIQYLIDNKDNLMNEIELGSLLGIELTPDTDFKDFMVILAYGSEGTHFYFDENDNLVWKNNPETNEKYGPRTIQYLIDNKDNLFDDVVNEFELGDLLGIELTPNSNFNDIMVILAYGDKGTHYDVNDNGSPEDKSDDFIYWLKDDEGNEYGPRTIQYLIDNKNNLMNEIKLGSLLGVELTPDTDFKDFMVILAYGNEGTHFYFDENDKLVWNTNPETNEEYGPRTIQYLIDNKDNLFDDMVNEFELGDLLGIELTPSTNFNDIMVILAYGDKGTHYDVNDNGTPDKADDDFIYWLKDDEGNKYGPRTVQYLIDNKNNLMNEIKLGSLLGVELTADSDFQDFMVILAYGNKDTHFYFDENNNLVWKTNPETNEEYGPRTIQYLINNQDTLFDDIIDNLELATVLGIDVFDESKDAAMLITIAYGNEGEHYLLDRENKTITWLKDENGVLYHATTIADLTERGVEVLDELYLDAILGVDAYSDGMMRSLAYGSEFTNYIIETVDGKKVVTMLPKIYYISVDGDVIDQNEETVGAFGEADANGVHPVTVTGEDGETKTVLYIKATDGIYYGYESADKTAEADRIFHKKTQLANLRNGSTSNLLNNIELGAALNINLLDDKKDDLLMVSLAYGNEGEHYEIVTNENGEKSIKWLNGNKPRTIANLQREGADILNDMSLTTLLDVSPLDEGSDSLMIALIYGNEDEHYIITEKDGKKDIEWLPNPEGGVYGPRTIGQFKNASQDLIDSLYLDAVLNLRPGDANSSTMMLSLAYGNEGTHYTVDENGNAVMLEKKVFIGDPDSKNNDVYDEEHIAVGRIVEEFDKSEVDGHTIYQIKEAGTGNTLYIRLGDEMDTQTKASHYHVYNTLEDAIADVNANEEGTQTRLFHEKTKFSALRTGAGATYIERIELSAALGIEITDPDANSMMIALIYGNEDEHYTVKERDPETGAITRFIWNTNPETGLPYHARTIHDLKNTDQILDEIYLDTILDVTASSPEIMIMLAFGSDYTIVDGKIKGDRKHVSDLKNIDTLIDDIYLDTALGLDANSPAVLLAIAYGANYKIIDGEVKSEERTTIGELKNNGTSEKLIKNIPLNKILSINADDAIMNYLVYGATNPTEEDKTTPNTLGYLMENSETFADDMLDALTLNDILTDELKENKFLTHIGTDTTISNLGDKLAGLSIQDILGVDMYEWAWFNPNNGYACVPEGTAGAVKCMAIKTGSGNYDYIAVQAHEATQTVGSTQYITYYALNDSTKKVLVAGNKMASPLTGVWKYLLTEKNVVIDGVSGDREISCDIMSLGSVSNNLTENMMSVTLYELQEDNIVSFEADSSGKTVLDTPLILSFGELNFTGATGATHLGDLTIQVAMNYIGFLLNIVNGFAG